MNYEERIDLGICIDKEIELLNKKEDIAEEIEKIGRTSCHVSSPNYTLDIFIKKSVREWGG